MPSPNCRVKNGSGSYQSTINGVDVTPSNTITINLVSSAGVSTWSIECITTDELSDADAVTAALSINTVAKTATFTAPAAGRAYRFRSTINGGIDANGVVRTNYSTTFAVFTRTAGGLRVHALDEAFESNATFGWVADINELIRTPPASNFAALTIQDASDTHTYTVQGAEIAADRTLTLPAVTGNDTFVTEGHTQTLTNKTLTSPTITSPTITTPTITSPVLTTPQINDTSSDHQYVFAVSELAADRTVTLPLLTGSDEFVFKDHPVTLTNKTLTSPVLTTPQINDTSSDHQYVFAVSELAADRTVTLPLLTGNDEFVFKDHTQTLAGKTLTSPTITGAVTLGSYTSTTTTSSDGKVVVIDAIGSVQTTDATVTSAYTSGTLTDEAVHSLEVIVTAIKSDGTAAATYKRHYAGRRDGGSWTQLAAVASDLTEETTSTWDCTVDVSSNTFRVRVTGVAANTIRWGYAIRHQATVP